MKSESLKKAEKIFFQKKKFLEPNENDRGNSKASGI